MTPDKDYKPNKDKTRGEIYQQSLPNIDGLAYLVQHLNNLGWCGSNGMGVTPLSFTEIDAYNRSTHSFLNGEEVMILRKMSQRYVSELNDRNPAKQPPHGKNIPLKNGFIEAMKSMAVVKKL